VAVAKGERKRVVWSDKADSVAREDPSLSSFTRGIQRFAAATQRGTSSLGCSPRCLSVRSDGASRIYDSTMRSSVIYQQTTRVTELYTFLEQTNSVELSTTQEATSCAATR
jgi:hypothetical protein